jgi:hypothetical protein
MILAGAVPPKEISRGENRNSGCSLAELPNAGCIALRCDRQSVNKTLWGSAESQRVFYCAGRLFVHSLVGRGGPRRVGEQVVPCHGDASWRVG